jgi:hypothetical protein
VTGGTAKPADDARRVVLLLGAVVFAMTAVAAVLTDLVLVVA